MLTSLSHASTLLVSSSESPVSLSNSNDGPLEQLRVLENTSQNGPVVGLLLYTVGIGIAVYEFTVTGSGRKSEKWFSSSYILGLE